MYKCQGCGGTPLGQKGAYSPTCSRFPLEGKGKKGGGKCDHLCTIAGITKKGCKIKPGVWVIDVFIQIPGYILQTKPKLGFS